MEEIRYPENIQDTRAELIALQRRMNSAEFADIFNSVEQACRERSQAIYQDAAIDTKILKEPFNK